MLRCYVAGHRIQHESKFLWQFHSFHHAIDTPSPFSTLYLHPVDSALQGGIPLALAAVVVCPAPIILYLFLGARLAENAINHSGMDSWLVDLVTLKLLPFRALPSFHDAHHKYSNHALNAKNYGESFWVWDVMFGTSSALVGHRPKEQTVAATVASTTSASH
jgi:sterol desaturase/sphingolipid hydroxylase (fatty acid hydroxylase superfamily)